VTLEEFRNDVLDTIRISATNLANSRTAFTEQAGARLVEAEELVDFVLCEYQGVASRKRRMQVDGYSYDELDNSLSLLISDFSDEERISAFGATEANRLFGMLKVFVEESLAGHFAGGTEPDHGLGSGLADQLNSWRTNVSRYRFYLVSDRQLSSRIKDWPIETIDGVSVEFHIWDIERFHFAQESASGRDDLIVDFTEFGEGVPCLKAGDKRSEYEGYLCIMHGNTLAGIFERFGSRLLEGNVRSYLSTKSKVNARIQVTIRNAPEMFFAYNNGITATAEHVEFESRKGELFLTHATNLQIVNGAQTTASLATAKRKDGADLSQVFVQMKLAVLPPERAGQLVPDIARFANSQNKVSDADFFSNHPYHIRLEEFSRRIWAPAVTGAQRGTHWFYERTRGQYLNEQAKLTNSQRSQFQLQNPKSKVLAKTDVAKLENTRRGIPHKVSLGAQKNFVLFAEWIAKQWEDDNTQFHEEYFRELVAYAILFRHAEGLVSVQPWYQGGYRANVVTYALAKLQDMITVQAPSRRLDLRHIWDRQAVPQILTLQLETICKRVFEVLTDSSRPKENVTEWAKMEGCWDRIRATTLMLDKEFDGQLVSTAAVRQKQRDAGDQQRTDNGIALQASVVAIAGKKWAEIRSWGEREGLLDLKELEMLRVAAMIPARLPSPKQCQLIWSIHAKLLANGLPLT
jgi:hypothetical protein